MLPTDHVGRQGCNVDSGTLCTAGLIVGWVTLSGKNPHTHKIVANIEIVWPLTRIEKKFLAYRNEMVVCGKKKKKNEGHTHTQRVLHGHMVTCLRLRTAEHNGTACCCLLNLMGGRVFVRFLQAG